MLFEKILNQINLLEMSNIRPAETGLNMVIYIGPQYGLKHGPRIKVSTKYGEKVGATFFTITIANEPVVIGKTGDIKSEDIDQVKEFVKLNKNVLLKLWNDEISPADAVNKFVRV